MMKQPLVLIALSLCLGCGTTKPAEENPFMSEFTTPYGVPPFDQIRLEHYMPAFLKGMEEQRKEIEAIVNNPAPADFENTIVAFDQSGVLLRRVGGVFGNQNSANTSDELQAINKELSPLQSAHRDDINLNPALFQRIKSVYDQRESLSLDKEQLSLLENTYKQFARNGANLDAAGQEQLRKLNSELSLLQIEFGQNMLAETNAFRLTVDKREDLSGLTDDLVAAAAAVAGEEGKWAFTLHNPSVMPFLHFADNRELREKMFTGYIERGNQNNRHDNKEIVAKLVKLRLEKARVLGYACYADYAIEDRMAKTPEHVMNLLAQVWEPTLEITRKDAKELERSMIREGVKAPLQGWDWRYYSEKVKKARFDLDDNEIRPYLRLENVLDGMFQVARRLYGITFREEKAIPKPHEEAMAFSCLDADGTHLGILYFDFFSRPSKRGGAWCSGYRSQTYKEGKRVVPVVTICCNYSKPVEDAPALLTPDEAETMFHEFGHGLHNLFKDVHYYGVSSVPRDFVELPSQIMEHWAFEPQVLKMYAKDYRTGEVIPDQLIEKITRSGKYGQGFATSEFVQAARLDMEYHLLQEVPADFEVTAFEAGIMQKMNALPQIPPRYRSTYFSHTMGGGYTAGYYSYMWSEVLDSDAYEAFKETGDIFDQATARRFRKYVLEPGGIDEADVMYRNFRGRDAAVDALLRNRGLK